MSAIHEPATLSKIEIFSKRQTIENKFDRVRKFVQLIFIYYKSGVSGWLGPEIRARPTHSLLGFPSYMKPSLKISW